ncbi:unnamed protein product, partial [Discosporangium mesarthrocarpum]
RFDDESTAVIFASFSRRRFCNEEDCQELAMDVPRTVLDLQKCLHASNCSRFDSNNPSGQGTAYGYYWKTLQNKKQAHALEPVPCFKSQRFEPYLVVKKSASLPQFDERFVGYGKNKIQWVNHLRYLGFRFYVMPVSFVVHAAHPKSKAKAVWEKSRTKNGTQRASSVKAMDQLFKTFMAELDSTLGENRITTHICNARTIN